MLSEMVMKVEGKDEVGCRAENGACVHSTKLP